MAVCTGYSLPFSVTYPAQELALGRQVSLQIYGAVTDDAAWLSETVLLFSSLASIGALGGRDVAPHATVFGPIESVSAGPDFITYELGCCCIADEALIVLAHLLLACEGVERIRAVEIQSKQEPGQWCRVAQSAASSTYPGIFGEMPFVLEDSEPEGGGYSFQFEFEAPLDAGSRQELNRICSIWCQAIGAGAYASAPMPAGDGYVEPDEEEVTAYGNRAEWAVFKVSADPDAALAAFLNGLVRFDRLCQRVRFVEIL